MHYPKDRRGFSLGELLLSLTLTIAVFASAVPFFTLQMRQMHQDMSRADAQQTARFAQNMVDRELRNIGIAVTPMQPTQGIPRNQPKIVQAHPFAVTFNSNLVAHDTVDMNAVYYDPNIPVSLTSAMAYAGMVTLPLTGVSYPDYAYRDQAGMISAAETISFWASVDSTAPSTDHYVLFRRVNDGPVTVVARGLRVPAGQALFQYRRVFANGTVDTLPTASLPLRWNMTNGLTDSIRTVTMSVRGVVTGYDLKNKAKTYERPVSAQTNMPNVGLAQRNSCGDIPLNPGSPSATIILDVSGNTERVRVQFTASGDEASGEKDVERYALFRRVVGDNWGEPFAVVGKAGGPYLFDDFDINPGTAYQYGVAAQDCSPANSTILGSANVIH